MNRFRVLDCGLRTALIMIVFLLATSATGQTTQPARMAAPATQPHEMPLPIVFARAGEETLVTVEPINLPSITLSLRAYGRTWAEATATNQKASFLVTFKVPQVQVPTLFIVTHEKVPAAELAQVVAYPDRDVKWDKTLTLYACGAPAWFDQWAAAVGLPVKQVAKRELPSAKLAPDEEDGKGLLILGSATAGKDLADVSKLADDKKINILVLDTGWFGEAAGAVSVAPAQMRASLSDISKQKWPQPLKFTGRRKPWPGIANRWAWIVDNAGLPLLEEIHASRWLGWQVVCSYLPWANVLGRREQADELLLKILKEAALLEASSAPVDAGRFGLIEVGMLYPARKDVSPSDRPVLSALPWRVYSAFEPPSLSVLDLRGQVQPPADILDKCRSIERGHNPDGVRKLRVKATDPAPWRNLLILGDDKLLDNWEWLKLDRDKKRIGRAGVQWSPADELPPSKYDQIRLMLKLTELGVPLSPPVQQEKQK